MPGSGDPTIARAPAAPAAIIECFGSMSKHKKVLPPSGPPTRVLIGGAIALALTLGAAFDSSLASQQMSRARADVYRVTAQAERLQPILETIGTAKRIGYVSEVPRTEVAGAAAFGAAQYFLAPRLVVVHGVASPGDWVLGNFMKPQNYAAFGEANGLMLVQDFGNGVVLYRKEAR